MKTEAIAAIGTKLMIGIVTAATLAGSGAIIKSTSTNAVQDQRLEQVETSLQKIDKLSDQLTEANTKMTVLQDRLDREVDK
jgi:TolA-binding protein